MKRYIGICVLVFAMLIGVGCQKTCKDCKDCKDCCKDKCKDVCPCPKKDDATPMPAAPSEEPDEAGKLKKVNKPRFNLF